jgi:hypothetical protein
LAAWLGVGALGCAPPNRGLVYDTVDPPPLTCHALLLDSTQVGQPYRKVALLQVRCSKLQPSRCEQLLRQRACDLGADAVLIEPNDKAPTRPSGIQMTQEAVAVRYEKPPSTR